MRTTTAPTAPITQGNVMPAEPGACAMVHGLLRGGVVPATFEPWSQRPLCDIDVVIACSKDAIVMVEGEADDGVQTGGVYQHGPRGGGVDLVDLAGSQLGGDESEADVLQLPIDEGLGIAKVAHAAEGHEGEFSWRDE